MARFPAAARLRQASQYRHVFTNGRRRADRYFVVIAARNGGMRARLGLAIAKRQAKRAVDRNRIKRIARESFRAHDASLTGLDIVILARRDTVAGDNQALFTSLAGHWRALTALRQSRGEHG